jgi:hypothetical protein
MTAQKGAVMNKERGRLSGQTSVFHLGFRAGEPTITLPLAGKPGTSGYVSLQRGTMQRRFNMKAIQTFGLQAVLTLIMTVGAHAQSFPQSVVGTYYINANGADFNAPLIISSQDASGNITGSVFGNPLKGFYDATSLRIVFYRNWGSTQDDMQFFDGRVFPCSYRSPSGPLCMAGTLQGFGGLTAPVNNLGWFGWKL